MTERLALDLLILAIRNVEKRYINEMFVPNPAMDEITAREIKLCERCFAYELYHQWRRLLDVYNECAGVKTTQHEIILNGEIPKLMERESREKYPDLVLHGGQSSLEHQLLVCEIKRYEKGSYPISDSILDDLYKLCFATSPKFKFDSESDDTGQAASFDCGVFILVNCNQEKMVERIKESLNKLKEKIGERSDIKEKNANEKKEKDYKKINTIIHTYCNKIFCISYDGNNLESVNLHEIYNDIFK